MAKYYQKYKKALEAFNYIVDDDGSVRDQFGNQAAAEDAYGNVQCKDPNISEICRKFDEKSITKKIKKAIKK